MKKMIVLILLLISSSYALGMIESVGDYNNEIRKFNTELQSNLAGAADTLEGIKKAWDEATAVSGHELLEEIAVGLGAQAGEDIYVFMTNFLNGLQKRLETARSSRPAVRPAAAAPTPVRLLPSAARPVVVPAPAPVPTISPIAPAVVPAPSAVAVRPVLNDRIGVSSVSAAERRYGPYEEVIKKLADDIVFPRANDSEADVAKAVEKAWENLKTMASLIQQAAPLISVNELTNLNIFVEQAHDLANKIQKVLSSKWPSMTLPSLVSDTLDGAALTIATRQSLVPQPRTASPIRPPSPAAPVVPTILQLDANADRSPISADETNYAVYEKAIKGFLQEAEQYMRDVAIAADKAPLLQAAWQQINNAIYLLLQAAQKAGDVFKLPELYALVSDAQSDFQLDASRLMRNVEIPYPSLQALGRAEREITRRVTAEPAQVRPAVPQPAAPAAGGAGSQRSTLAQDLAQILARLSEAKDKVQAEDFAGAKQLLEGAIKIFEGSSQRDTLRAYTERERRILRLAAFGHLRDDQANELNRLLDILAGQAQTPAPSASGSATQQPSRTATEDPFIVKIRKAYKKQVIQEKAIDFVSQDPLIDAINNNELKYLAVVYMPSINQFSFYEAKTLGQAWAATVPTTSYQVNPTQHKKDFYKDPFTNLVIYGNRYYTERVEPSVIYVFKYTGQGEFPFEFVRKYDKKANEFVEDVVTGSYNN